jgi:tetratricopeptide (TPR) repeat protein
MSELNNYRSTFQQFIHAGLRASLARVQAAEPIVPEVERQQAWHMLSFALGAPEVWEATRSLLLALAPKMEQAGFRQEWLPYLEQGVQVSQHQQDYLAEAELALQIGILQRLLSKFDLARQWLTASLTQSVAFKQIDNQVQALNELAWLDYLQQRYQGAAAYAQQALALIGDNGAERGMSYRVLGMIASDQERWQEAETYHRMTVEIFEAEGSLRKIARGLANLADALRGQGRFQESILYHQRVIGVFKGLGDVHHLAIAQMNLGIVYHKCQEVEQALIHYQKADGLFRKLYDKINLAHNCTNLGISYLGHHEIAKAEKNFCEAITIYQELEETGWRLNAMDGLAMALIADQRFDKAMDLLEQALTVLPTVQESVNYAYLQRSLDQHLNEAKLGQEQLVRCS